MMYFALLSISLEFLAQAAARPEEASVSVLAQADEQHRQQQQQQQPQADAPAQQQPQSLDDQPPQDNAAPGGSMPAAPAPAHAPRLVVFPTDFEPTEVPESSPHFRFPGQRAWKVPPSKWTYVDLLEYDPPREPKDTRVFAQFESVRMHTRSASAPEVNARIAFAAVAPRPRHGFDEEIIVVAAKHAREAKANACVPFESERVSDAQAQETLDIACQWIRDIHGKGAHNKAHHKVSFASPGSYSLRSGDRSPAAGGAGSQASASPSGAVKPEPVKPAPDALAEFTAKFEQQVAASVSQIAQPIAAATQVLSQAVVNLTKAAAALERQHTALAASAAQGPAAPSPAKRGRTETMGGAEDTAAAIAGLSQQPVLAGLGTAAIGSAVGAPGTVSLMQLQSLLAAQALERSQMQAANLAVQLALAAPAAPHAAQPAATPTTATAAHSPVSAAVQPARPKRKSRKRKQW
jgi:hypothetical protein